jgi:hypothetical protein
MAARTILGGVGIPAERVRQAIVDLEAAFNLAV